MFPGTRPEAVDVGWFTVPIEAVPAIKDQLPVPVVTLEADSVHSALQTVKSVTVIAASGFRSLTIVTEEVAGGQTPLVTVQTRMFVPVPIELRADAAFPGATILALPTARDQYPEPAVGLAADKVKLSAHKV